MLCKKASTAEILLDQASSLVLGGRERRDGGAGDRARAMMPAALNRDKVSIDISAVGAEVPIRVVGEWERERGKVGDPLPDREVMTAATSCRAGAVVAVGE